MTELTPKERRACADAEDIFRAAVARVDPLAMMRQALGVEGAEMIVTTEIERARYDLTAFDRVLAVGMGKASAPMAVAVEEALGERLAGGLVAVKDACAAPLSRLRVLEAGHPVPDERSSRAALEVLGLGRAVDDRTLVLILISGGGSALLCAPAPGLAVADKAATTELLLASGATIQEVNCVRKHLSAIKGGRLAAALAPAAVVSLVLSDVMGDDLDAIASGPTVPDPTTWSDAFAVVRRYGLEERLPAPALDVLRRGAAGDIPDTPKPGDALFGRTRNHLVGTNRLALAAAAARALGYETLILTSRLVGEARMVAPVLLAIGLDIAASGSPLHRPACLLTGGETTVTVRGRGRGGRNQEMALAFLAALDRAPREKKDLVFLSAATDGGDGPTQAAGAFATAGLLARARASGLDPEAYLADNDSSGFFEAAGGLLTTGPTCTNVCDVQVLIVP